MHFATTRMAAEAGKHVFLDKPIGNTVAEGLKIARVCEAAGVVLALGECSIAKLVASQFKARALHKSLFETFRNN